MDSKIGEIEKNLDKLLSHYSYDALGSEDSFQNIMDTMFRTRFNQVLSQWKTKDGRIDTIVFYDSRIFVIEYKYNKSSEKALDQIHDKKYYDDAVVMESKLPILLLGINLKKDASNNKQIKISYELCRGNEEQP
jgi:PD-(D/E)XK nuclease superfamily